MRTTRTPRSSGASSPPTAAASQAGDIDAIGDMTSIAAELDDAIKDAVAGLRATGYSWADMAARLGATRQAAQQRGRRV